MQARRTHSSSFGPMLRTGRMDSEQPSSIQSSTACPEIESGLYYVREEDQPQCGRGVAELPYRISVSQSVNR